tara:strand:+ start:550 stop:816 length:267 start_codon:yes stop_codon:yes gene_type:complete
MAHSKQAKKRIRQTDRRSAINRGRRSRMRTFIRGVEEAIASGDKATAVAALKVAEPEIMRGRRQGVVHLNTAARKISQLTRKVNTMAG